MSAVEWQHWLAYADIDPFTEDRADLRAGIVAHAVAASAGIKCSPSDFMPKWEQVGREQTEDEQKFALMKMTKLLGGQVKQQGK